MIVDSLETYNRYSILGKNIKKAFEFLYSGSLESLSVGMYEIDGTDVFALVQEYDVKSAKGCWFERHEKYIDIQYVVNGSELIGYSPFTNQEVVSEYHNEHDYALYSGEASFMKIDAGMFAIFFPGELHMPGIGDDASKVRKIVMKVKV